MFGRFVGTVTVASAVWFHGLGSAQQQRPTPAYRIATVAGTGFAGDGGLATAASIAAPEGLAVDSAGNLYLADNAGHRIRKVDSSGRITTIAGNGTPGFRGDGGPAAASVINAPYSLVLDPAGNLYFADYGNQRIRRISAQDGVISTIAGGGGATAAAGASDALSARFLGPRNLAIDRAGNIYISDFADHRLYRVSPGGGIAALNVPLKSPTGLAVDRDGTSLYIADSGNRAIQRLAAASSQLTPALTLPSGTPLGLAVDPRDGSLLIALSNPNQLVRHVPGGGTVSIVAGTESAPSATRDVAVSASGAIFFSRARQVFRSVSTSVAVVAGDGVANPPIVENAEARRSVLQSPMGIVLDTTGGFFIAEEASKRVRRVSPDGLVRTVAGGGLPVGSSNGDGGPATAARLEGPAAVAWDPVAGLRIADAAAHRVRGVLASGNIFTVAGDGEPGFRGDNGPASQARLNRPRGVAFDRAGNLYIADTGNHRIRRVAPSGFIATVAGSGVRGYFGDGGPAAQAQLNGPQGVAIDADGALYIADTGNHAVRRVAPDGSISTVAGTGFRGPAALNLPAAVAADPREPGVVFVADTFNHRVRRLDVASGRIDTVAGDGTPGYWGDDGAALAASLNAPTGLAVHPASGVIYIADFDNQRIRLLAPDASLAPPSDSPALPPAEVAATPPAEIVVMNAASLRSGPVAPGMIASVFGTSIGPARAVTAELSAAPGGAGRLPFQLAGIDVRFDGTPAAIFYASPDQLNVEVPRLAGAPRDNVAVEVRLDTKLVAAGRVSLVSSQPALFTTQPGLGPAVAVNEDGTVNSESNPAARGSVVTLFATGDGATDPVGIDGIPAGNPPPRAAQPVSVRVGGAEAEVLFAGRAPGFVGLLQLNVRLPGVFTAPGIRPLLLTVGGVASQSGVTIAVR